MSQEFTIDWVGDRTTTDKHGNTVYYISLEGYTGAKSLRHARKAESRPPQVGEKVYGGVQVYSGTDPETGEEWARHVFKRERRPDNGGTGQPVGGMNRIKAQAVRDAAESPTPEFWAQKDRRLARAGMTQAVVSGLLAAQPNFDSGHQVADLVRVTDSITDALLASLDEKAPSPNNDQPKAGSLAETAAALAPDVAVDDFDAQVEKFKQQADDDVDF